MPASCRICRTWRSSTVLELVGLRLNVRPSEAAPLPPGLGPWDPWRACSAARSRRHWSLSVSIARRQRSTIAAIDCNTCSTKTPHRITCFREKTDDNCDDVLSMQCDTIVRAAENYRAKKLGDKSILTNWCCCCWS